MQRYKSRPAPAPAIFRRQKVGPTRSPSSLGGLGGLVVVATTSVGLVAIFLLLTQGTWELALAIAVLSPVFGIATSWSWQQGRTMATTIFPAADQESKDEAGNRIRLGLVELMRVHDEATFEHSSWLAETATKLGAEVGIHGAELERLRWAALLHDLGKIAVSRATLSKAGRLTEAELTEIRRHPTIGADLIAAVLPHDIALSEAVRHHHERWDGCGYPAGLVGEAIPVASRIVAVVDVFEALTSDRAYRSALTLEQAAVYIRDGAGSHFDPRIAGAFLGIMAMGTARDRRRQHVGSSGGQVSNGRTIQPTDSAQRVRL